jgi:hypothetical protein
MGDNRAAVLVSLAFFAGCGSKVVANGDNRGGDPTSGTTTTTGTTTGMAGINNAGSIDSGVGTGTSGFGGSLVSTPCGSVSCAPGLVCCNESCGVCVQPNQGCPAIACAVDAGTGGGGGSTVINVDEVASSKSDFGFAWKDSWFISGCPLLVGYDCITAAMCPNQNALDVEDKGAVVTETFPLGGALGTMYAVTFVFNGLMEGRYYTGGQWAEPSMDVATPGGPPSKVNESGIGNDTFYIGGTAVASNYAVMRMRVLDSNKKEFGRYYMNAYPADSNAETKRTFLISYSHTILVPGRGFVEYRLADSNCHMVDNCGAGPPRNATCDKPARDIPNEPNVVLPAMYTDVASPIQPFLVPLASLNPITGAKQPWHSQMSHLTVTRVVAMQ